MSKCLSLSPEFFGFLWAMDSHPFLQSTMQFISENTLFGKDDILLCAVSGGVDSMAMVTALHLLNFRLEIAHVNYGLRGKDSDADEALVSIWASERNIPFHLKKAGPEFHLDAQSSLQEKARDFRYQWLEKLAGDQGIQHILLAHHAGDQTETILLQLFRGAGPRGLQGMLPASGLRKRPFLQNSREEILSFAREFSIVWREDSSNAGLKYRRNIVRHKLIPVLEEIFPSFESVLHRNARRMGHVSAAVDFLFSQLEKEFLFKTQPGKTEFNLEQIIAHPMAEFFMVELLLRHGFSFPDSEELSLRRKNTESIFRENGLGSRIEIRFPRLILFDSASAIFPEIEIQLASNQSHDLPSGKILKTWTDYSAPKNLPAFSWMADPEKISFPIRLRLCAPGDKMAVFGMSGQKKKVSDLLTEAKLSPTEKAETWLAEDSKGQILWIPGLRQAEICRLPENFSGPVFCMELLLPEEN